MASTLKLLWKIFVKQFYILNAGFFLLSFILAFGIIHPPQLIIIHRSLILGIINSNVFTWVILSLWLLYNFKCTFFCLRIIQKEEDTILFNLQSLAPVKQWTLLLLCHCSLYAPMIIYSGFVIFMANQQGFLLYNLGIILFQLVTCTGAVYIYYYKINYTWKLSSFDENLFSVFKFRFSIKPPTYLLYYTLHSRKIIFLILKIAGMFLLNMVFSAEREDFIMRDFVLVFMIVVLIHSLMVYYYVYFMEKMMSVTRNLPITRLHRFFFFLFTYTLILMPEMLFIIINGHALVPVYTVLSFYGIAVAELLLFTSVLYLYNMKMKPYLKIVFCMYLVISILMLSENYVSIGLINLAIAMGMFYKNFYRYEAEP